MCHTVTVSHFPCCHLLVTQQNSSRAEIWHSQHYKRQMNRFLCWGNFIWLLESFFSVFHKWRFRKQHRGIDMVTNVWIVKFVFLCVAVQSLSLFTYDPYQILLWLRSTFREEPFFFRFRFQVVSVLLHLAIYSHISLPHLSKTECWTVPVRMSSY